MGESRKRNGGFPLPGFRRVALRKRAKISGTVERVDEETKRGPNCVPLRLEGDSRKMNATRQAPAVSNDNSRLAFQLPDNLLAGEPAELRGLSRDDVRLMVIHRATGLVQHTDFGRLPNFLKRNDLLVFNSSRTLPASLVGMYLPTGSKSEVRLAEHLPDDSWLALLPARGCENANACVPRRRTH